MINNNISVLAFNSVLRDARILKEARSLAQSGYKVTVFGFEDNNVPHQIVEESDNLSIHILDWRTNLIQVLKYFRLIMYPFFISLICLFSYLSYPSIVIYLTDNSGFYILAVILSAMFIFGLTARYCASLVITVVKRIIPFSILTKYCVLIAHVSKLKPALIHCHDMLPLVPGSILKRITKAKLVFDAHEIYEDLAQAKKLKKITSKCILSIFQYSIDGFITINDNISKFYTDNYKAVSSVTIIKNATVKANNVRYDYRLHDKSALPHTQKIAIYQGGFAKNRGLELIVSAGSDLYSDWSIVLMGWGTLQPQLEALAQDVNTAAKSKRETAPVVIIPPCPQQDLPEWTIGASIGLIVYEDNSLNHRYCTPNKLWEYPNADVPILSNPLVEISKVINEYEIGWLLPADVTGENIANAINALSDEKIEIARKNCNKYMERDNWSVYEQRLINLYDRLLTN